MDIGKIKNIKVWRGHIKGLIECYADENGADIMVEEVGKCFLLIRGNVKGFDKVQLIDIRDVMS